MAKQMIQLNKVQLAQIFNLSRASLYYQPKQPLIDQKLKEKIKLVMDKNPTYGHKRVALALKINKKRVLRVMKKFNLEPQRSRKRPRKKRDENKASVQYSNLIKSLKPRVPNYIWVGDFTCFKFKQKLIYLATILDQFTREVVGWHVSPYHNQALVIGALTYALKKNNFSVPKYFHSDQGSEYDSQAHTQILKSLGVKISMSRKASPWENPHQESFYSHFKLDLGNPNRFETLGELIEAIHQTINYYNNRRIHTALGMPPTEFRKQFENQTKPSDYLSKKWGI